MFVRILGTFEDLVRVLVFVSECLPVPVVFVFVKSLGDSQHYAEGVAYRFSNE